MALVTLALAAWLAGKSRVRSLVSLLTFSMFVLRSEVLVLAGAIILSLLLDGTMAGIVHPRLGPSVDETMRLNVSLATYLTSFTKGLGAWHCTSLYIVPWHFVCRCRCRCRRRRRRSLTSPTHLAIFRYLAHF